MRRDPASLNAAHRRRTMSRKYFPLTLLTLFTLLLSASGTAAQDTGPDPGLAAQAALGTAFTYQGQLQRGGSPVTDTCNFQFSLWDAASGGAQIGSMQTKSGVSVVNGLFT